MDFALCRTDVDWPVSSSYQRTVLSYFVGLSEPVGPVDSQVGPIEVFSYDIFGQKYDAVVPQTSKQVKIGQNELEIGTTLK